MERRAAILGHVWGEARLGARLGEHASGHASKALRTCPGARSRHAPPLQLDLALPGLFFSSSIRKRITMKQTLRGCWPTRPGWPFVPASREGPGGVATGDGRRGEG